MVMFGPKNLVGVVGIVGIVFSSLVGQIALSPLHDTAVVVPV